MVQDCGHSHTHDHGVSGQGLSARMAQAEARLPGPLTAPRRRVLELMYEAGQPVKAYDLMASFGDEPAKPPTVYRALDYLEKQGLIHRIESLGAYVVCSLEAGHHAACLICDCCGATEEVDPAGAGGLGAQAARANFEIRGVTIEAHGLCVECR